MQNRKVTFLLIDDDDVDVILINRLFKKHQITNHIIRVKDGTEAMAILNNEGNTAAIQKPYLIILDINMPKMNGIEFLENIRNNPKHTGAIIFVLTTSQYESDRMKAYSYNIAGYIAKSNFIKDTDKFINLLKTYIYLVDFPD